MKIGEIRPLEKIDLEIIRGENIRTIRTKVESPISLTKTVIIIPHDLNIRDEDELYIVYSKDSKLLRFACKLEKMKREAAFNLIEVSSFSHGKSCNRRGGFRVKCYLPAIIYKDSKQISCKCTDISVTGIFLETEEDLSIEEVLDVSIEIDKSNQVSKMRIKRKAEKGYGLQFEDCQLRRISEFIAKKQIEEIKKNKY